MNEKIIAKFVNSDFLAEELENIGFDKSYRIHATEKNIFKTQIAKVALNFYEKKVLKIYKIGFTCNFFINS